MTPVESVLAAGRSRKRGSLSGHGKLLVLLVAILAVLSIALDSGLPAALATIVLGIVATGEEFRRKGWEAVSPMTAALVMASLAGLADSAALLLQHSDLHEIFFLYESEAHIPKGLLVGLVGMFSLWLGHEGAERLAVGAWLPRVAAKTSVTATVVISIGLYASRYALESLQLLTIFGIFSSLARMSGALAAFVLTRVGVAEEKTGLLNLGILVAVVETVRAAMFETLRTNMIIPVGSAILGVLAGSRSMRSLLRIQLIPIYFLAIIGGAFFGTFGQERRNVGRGIERLDALQDIGRSSDGQWHIVARFSSLNQVSRLVALTEESGFRRGETLQYLRYVWVPRVLWPSKPIIANGQWFAGEIGQGVVRPDGSVTNAVNMTIAGECYLNFGWVGVLVGCSVVGALFSSMWRATCFWTRDANLWGNVLGLSLLILGAAFVVDLQLVPTAIGTYAVCVMMASVSHGSRRAASAARSEPENGRP